MPRPNLPKILSIVFLSAALQTACDDAGSNKTGPASEQQVGNIESMLQAFEKDVEQEAAVLAPNASGESAAMKSATVTLAGNPETGRKVFKKCAVCHRAEKNAGKKVGPNLWGIINREKGTVEGFKFSAAIKNAGGTWTEADLDGYIESPKKFLPGSRMAFAGIRKPQARADLIAYLKSLTD